MSSAVATVPPETPTSMPSGVRIRAVAAPLPLPHESDRIAGAAATPAQFAHILHHAERLCGSATGALVYDTTSPLAGSVLVEYGRICWAVAAGAGRRLTHLLKEHSNGALTEALLERTFRDCRQHGLPLGEVLVATGLVNREELWGALRQHTVESIARLALRAENQVPRWVSHKRQRYDAWFTFAPVELLVARGELAEPDRAAHARLHLQRVLRGGGFGAAFAEGSARPLAVEGDGWLRARELVQLGTWVERRVLEAERTGERTCAGVAPDGAAWIAWRYGSVLYASRSERLELVPLKLACLHGTLRLLSDR